MPRHTRGCSGEGCFPVPAGECCIRAPQRDSRPCCAPTPQIAHGLMISPTRLTVDYAAAIVHALEQEMDRHPRVFLYGEGINDAGAYLNSTDGIAARFGEPRCFDVPN